MPACPICNAAACRIRYHAYDDRYAYPGDFGIARCDQCRHVIVVADTTPLPGERLYTDYYPRAAFELESFRPRTFPGGLHSWLNGDDCAACRWVPEGVKVLDIGCGFGESLAYYRLRGSDAYGVELDENVRTAAARFHFNIRVGPFDRDCYAPGTFDYVTLQQVIEHVDDPGQMLKDVAQVLRAGGYVVLSTPNANGWGARLFGRRWINWHVPYHRHFFSPASMALVAERAGLQVEMVRTITSSEWLRFQWSHLLTMPDRGDPSPFWSRQGRQNVRQSVGRKLFELLHFARINHLLTRLFDSLGAGDNFLFLLKKP